MIDYFLSFESIAKDGKDLKIKSKLSKLSIFFDPMKKRKPP